MDNEFTPRKSLVERYGSHTLTPKKIKELEQQSVIKEQIRAKYLAKGCTDEQAETMALMIMYIPGFSGPTLKD